MSSGTGSGTMKLDLGNDFVSAVDSGFRMPNFFMMGTLYHPIAHIAINTSSKSVFFKIADFLCQIASWAHSPRSIATQSTNIIS